MVRKNKVKEIKIEFFNIRMVVLFIQIFFFLTRITRIKTRIVLILSYGFNELTNFTNFTNLECSRFRIFDYEFYELTNFTNSECSRLLYKNTPN